jgi:hypothetical protein
MKRNNQKTLLLLGGVLVVLAGVAALLANPFSKPATDVNGAVNAGDSGSGAKVLVASQKDAITAVGIKQNGLDEFKLEKKGDSWTAGQGDKHYKADQDKVDKILEILPGLTSESLASSNADKYKEYGVDDESAMKVEIFAGGDKPASTLLIGESAPGSSSSFVRVDGGKEVWRTAQNVKAPVGFSFRDYRSKKPWPFDPQIVKSLTVRPVGGQPDKYTFDNGVWKTASGANANQNDIVKLLEDWSKTTVNDFADDVTPGVTKFTPLPPAAPAGSKPAAPAPPAAEAKLDVGLEPNLLVETPQGTFSLTLGEKDGSLYYVADQDKLVYKIAEPNLAFFRNLKFDELKIPAAEEAAKSGTAAPGTAAAPGAAITPGTPAAPGKPGTPAAPPGGNAPAKPGAPPAPAPSKPGAPAPPAGK